MLVAKLIVKGDPQLDYTDPFNSLGKKKGRGQEKEGKMRKLTIKSWKWKGRFLSQASWRRLHSTP